MLAAASGRLAPSVSASVETIGLESLASAVMELSSAASVTGASLDEDASATASGTVESSRDPPSSPPVEPPSVTHDATPPASLQICPAGHGETEQSAGAAASSPEEGTHWPLVPHEYPSPQSLSTLHDQGTHMLEYEGSGQSKQPEPVQTL
jgi:hypothetical protein